MLTTTSTPLNAATEFSKSMHQGVKRNFLFAASDEYLYVYKNSGIPVIIQEKEVAAFSASMEYPKLNANDFLRRTKINFCLPICTSKFLFGSIFFFPERMKKFYFFSNSKIFFRFFFPIQKFFFL